MVRGESEVIPHLFLVFSSLSGLFLGISFGGWHVIDVAGMN
jgi:hypothetical protein